MRAVKLWRNAKEQTGIGDSLVYYLLVDENEELESYGIGILEEERGAKTAVRGITYSRSRIERIARDVYENCVTPVALRDVVEDLILA